MCLTWVIQSDWLLFVCLDVSSPAGTLHRTTGTVKGSVIYKNIAQRHQENNLKIHDHNKNKSGAAGLEWECFALCASVVGHTALTTPLALSSSQACAAQPASSLPPSQAPTPPYFS